MPLLVARLREHPGEAPAAQLLGQCHFDRKEYTEAAAALKQAAAATPKSAEVRFYLGSALGLAGRAPEAIEQLQEATRLDPAFAPAFRVLGMFQFQNGHLGPKTREALETAVRLDPEDARAAYWLGSYFFEMKDFAKARSQFERALALTPDSQQARLAYGRTLLSLGETERALEAFDAVLRTEPDSGPALLGRAKCLYAGQKPLPALAAAEEALHGVTDAAFERDGLWVLARIYRELGRTAEMQRAERRLAELDAARERREAKLEELQMLASKLHAEHDLPGVIRTLEESLAIQERQDSLVMLGDAYMATGRVAEAERCFLRAVQAGPEWAEASRRLELLRKRYGSKQ